MSDNLFPPLDLDPIVRLALEEDFVDSDVTTNILVPSDSTTSATIVAKESLTLAGIPLLEKIFELLDSSVVVQAHRIDGETIQAGEVVASLHGSTKSILTGERAALNFLQHLSGVATLTKAFCDTIREYPTKILDTRKTTPGLRRLEKWAVTMGSGINHRMSLSDGILIKDNHIAAARVQGLNLEEVVRKAVERAPKALQIEVEVETREQAQHAIDAGAHILLLDNMSLDEMRRVVRMAKGRALTEASGGIELAKVRAVAETGVDFISSGALTHSVRALDINMELQV